MSKALLLFAVLAVFARTAIGQDAVLEHYVFGVGQNSEGTTSALRDRAFGGGTARAGLLFTDTVSGGTTGDPSGELSIGVKRKVAPGEIVFALLCFGIEISGFDEAGMQVFAKDLPGFTFGDSQPGTYAKRIRKIPTTVSRLEVKFIGNYE